MRVQLNDATAFISAVHVLVVRTTFPANIRAISFRDIPDARPTAEIVNLLHACLSASKLSRVIPRANQYPAE